MIENINIVDIVLFTLEVIGGATVAFRFIAPITKNKKDDKILKFLESILRNVSLNKETSEVKVKIK